ncbi:hypothetical protein LTR86_008234 [Recurvomyces mirabilis]|nr:hypothetical protein LTR86_008234 [Recurvomyces mirabilis]
MSFGFGNNNNSGSTFGGFGNTNNSSSGGGGGGFGANNNTSTGGSLFGGSTATAGGFGGFGASNTQQSNPFAANKPAFGATATTSGGGGLFGGGTSTSGGFGAGGAGGFGNTANTSTGFGNNAGAGGSLFGNTSNNASTGFGGSGTTGSNPFSTSTNNASTGFGASNTTGGGGGFGGFGASTTSAGNNNQGTATVPFQAIQEKEPTGTGTQSFQSVTFQEPYKNKSFEELRTEDYAQGRKYGNANGQAGAFGQSTGFGGFGNNNNNATAQTTSAGGMFGSTTATSGNSFGGFGNTQQNTNPTSGFGASTGGGLFGNQNKPAGGGLFGNSNTSAAPASNPFGGTTGTTGGGLFGNNNSTGGFGANNSSTTTGGGLFGNNNAVQPQQQNTAFGQSSTTTGGGLFGNAQNKPATGGLFGNTATQNTGGGLFGNANNNAQQASSNPFGQSGTTGGGLFGNNSQQTQNKPAFGNFGQTNNTTNSFGAGNNNTGGGLFGNTNQQQNTTGGGLFGNQNKPAAGGLFGNSTNNNATGGGLFGNTNNQQQNAGGSLFGNNNNNAGGSLFGNSQNKPAGNSLFGNTAPSNNGGSLFGNSQSNQNNGNSLFGNTNQNQQSSLFGNTNNQQQQGGQPQNQLFASVTGAPYGNEQLFASLATSNPPIGPLATPLNGAKPVPRKTPSLMTSMRLNSPVYTPRGGSVGRNGGYGFSYSTYGTPGSAFTGSLTPGASSLLRPTGSFSSGLSSRLNKSISMGNLRGDGTPAESRPSLLRESAFSPPGSSGRYGNGSVRKLNIDRSLRTDLFGKAPEPEQPSRRVRYDSTAETPDEIPREQSSNALVRTESQDTEQEDDQRSPGLMKAPPAPKQANGPPRQPEMSQVNGSNSGLSSVPEDGVPQRPGSAPATQQKPAPSAGVRKDNEVGDYFTEPKLRDLRNMSRQQLQKLGRLIVGREGVGRIEFSACDLSTTQLDDICGGIVRLIPRSATVYQDDSDKPVMGKALNVPSIIHLDNSWPRSQGGRKAVSAKEGREYDKHIARLKRVGGTKFVNYDADTGVWTFSVDHFTTYGLDDDDEDFTETEVAETSGLSDAPATPDDQRDETMQSVETQTGEMDDTFQFQLTRRSENKVPGGFEDQGVSYDYDDPSADEEMAEQSQHVDEDEQFRSSGGAVQAPSPGALDRYHSSLIEDEQTGEMDMDMDAAGDEEDEPEIMPGSFAPQEAKMLRSILKPSRGLDDFASPEKLATESWEDQLQRTMSPKKRDRGALREMQQSFMKAREQGDVIESPFKQSIMGRSTMGQSALNQSYLAQKSAKKGKVSMADTRGGESAAFRTSMDIMKSLWQDDGKGRKTGSGAKGFEYPYSKKARLSTSDGLNNNDAAFHNALKPSFSADGTMVFAGVGAAAPELVENKLPVVGEHKDVRFAKFVQPLGLMNATLDVMQAKSEIKDASGHGMPAASLVAEFNFQDLAQQVRTDKDAKHESAIWRLCSVLFDPLEVACAEIKEEVPQEEWKPLAARMRRDAFVSLWSELITADVNAAVQRAKSAEERALLLLTKNDVVGACEVLVTAKNFRLATLVAQLPGSATTRQVMKNQMQAWQKRKDWSEMSDAIRALYSILAGDVCTVAGATGASEDRIESFVLSERFDLDWKQSLALRVLCGGHATLHEAVKAFDKDVKAGQETAQPISAFDGEDVDTLAALLRLYAAPREHTEAHMAALCEPSTTSGSAMNSRVAWQLAVMLSSKSIARLSQERMAQLTLEFGAQLEAANHVVEAAWMLLYLKDRTERGRAISALLQRKADKLEIVADALVNKLHIPEVSISAALALLAKANGDIFTQTAHLLNAKEVSQAHDILIEAVGPQAIIEEDYEGLAELLHRFQDGHNPSGWEKGGAVYKAFLELVHSSSGHRSSSKPKNELIRNVKRGLRRAEEESEGRARGLEERVAAVEMGRVVERVERELAEESGGGRGKSQRPGSRGGKSDIGLGMGLLEKYRAEMGQFV